MDALAAARLSVWQFLPTGPTGFGDSPYQPLSTFAGNELLIDIENLVELNLIDPADTADLRELPAEYVDFGKLIPAKSALLSPRGREFSVLAPTPRLGQSAMPLSRPVTTHGCTTTRCSAR